MRAGGAQEGELGQLKWRGWGAAFSCFGNLSRVSPRCALQHASRRVFRIHGGALAGKFSHFLK